MPLETPYALPVCKDITDKRQLKNELFKEQRKVMAIIHDMSEIVLSYKPDFTITFANPIVYEYLNIAHTEFIGMNIQSFFEQDIFDKQYLKKIVNRLKQIDIDSNFLTNEYKISFS